MRPDVGSLVTVARVEVNGGDGYQPIGFPADARLASTKAAKS